MTKKESRLKSKKRKLSALLDLIESNKTTTEDAEESKVKKPRLEGEDYEALKRRLRERKKLLKTHPKFDLKRPGHDASIEVLETQRKPLFMSDLQHLVMYALAGDRAPYQPHHWCKLEKWNKLKSTAVLVIDGDIGLNDFLERREEWEVISALFPHKLHVLSPLTYGASVAEELSLLRLSRRLKLKILQDFGDLSSAVESNALSKLQQNLFPQKYPAKVFTDSLKIKLLLNAQQMLAENYPLPIRGFYEEKYSHYVLTCEEYDPVVPDSPMLSIDCEMCMTSIGKLELTSVSVVDENLKVVYQSLVKPKNKIVNYLTQYSGITEEMLKDVKTTLQDVQEALKACIPPNGILIGHSLNGDLHALEMMHPYVIDTSVIYNISGIRKRKPKLAVLTSLYLGREIQVRGGLGHDPVEDSQAAMELTLLKLRNGYEFGDVVLGGKISHKAKNVDQYGASFLKELSTDKSFKVIGKSSSLSDYDDMNQTFFDTVSSTKEAVERACEAVVENNLTICHIKSPTDEKKTTKLSKWTSKLWKKIPENSLFITIWSGSKFKDAFVGIALKQSQERIKSALL